MKTLMPAKLLHRASILETSQDIMLAREMSLYNGDAWRNQLYSAVGAAARQNGAWLC